MMSARTEWMANITTRASSDHPTTGIASGTTSIGEMKYSRAAMIAALVSHAMTNSGSNSISYSSLTCSIRASIQPTPVLPAGSRWIALGNRLRILSSSPGFTLSTCDSYSLSAFCGIDPPCPLS